MMENSVINTRENQLTKEMIDNGYKLINENKFVVDTVIWTRFTSWLVYWENIFESIVQGTGFQLIRFEGSPQDNYNNSGGIEDK